MAIAWFPMARLPPLRPAIPAAQDCPPGVSASWHGLSPPWLPSRSEIPVRTNLPATLGRARDSLRPGIESSRPQPAPRLGPEPLSLHDIPSNNLPCQVSTRQSGTSAELSGIPPTHPPQTTTTYAVITASSVPQRQVDYLWDYTEVHGVANRMVVVMGSDFGRTNKYSAQGGKDHWPIGSFIVMEKNQHWANRVVGETDELHFA